MLCAPWRFDIKAARNLKKANSKTMKFNFANFLFNVTDMLFYTRILYIRQPTLGSLIREGGRVLVFRFFFTPPRTLLSPHAPCLLILAKDVKSSTAFLCINNIR